MAFSPDGQTVASGSDFGAVHLWRTDGSPLVRILRGDFSPAVLTSIAFSPDGQTLAVSDAGLSDRSARQFSRIQLWSVKDGVLLHTFPWKKGNIYSLAFSPDGRQIAFSFGNGIGLWQVHDRSLVYALEDAASNCIAFSPDGEILACGSGEGRIEWRKAKTGDLLRWWAGIDAPRYFSRSVNSLAFSPDGFYLASGSAESVVRLWKVGGNALRRRWSLRNRPKHTALEGPDWVVRSIAFSSDGKTLAAGSFSGPIRSWRFSDGAISISTIEVGPSTTSIAFSPDGKTLASGSLDSSSDSSSVWPLRLWQVSDGALLRTLGRDSDAESAQGVAFSPDGRILASRTLANRIHLYQVTNGALLRTLDGSENIQEISFTQDGQLFAACSGNYPDINVSLWRIGDGMANRLLHTLDKGYHTAFSPNGQMLFTYRGHFEEVRCWSVENGLLLYTTSISIDGDTDKVAAFSSAPTPGLHPDLNTYLLTQTIAVGVHDRNHRGYIRLLGVAGEFIPGDPNPLNFDVQVLHTLDSIDKSKALAFSFDGRYLAEGHGHSIWLRRVADGKVLCGLGLSSLESKVSDLAFSPDGQVLASTWGKTIQLWQVGQYTSV